jgi:hypothetical protein
MKVITPGHLYELKNVEGAEPQRLQFIHKVPVQPGSTEFKTISDGTTNEEVIGVLINRLQILNQVQPSREVSIAITKFEEGFLWLLKRNLDAVAQSRAKQAAAAQTPIKSQQAAPVKKAARKKKK